MKTIRNFPLFLITLLMVMFISHSAFAAKTLSVGTASVNNSGDEASRTVTLDLKAIEFDNANGMVFTLTYDAAVFEYVEMVQSDKPIDDSDHAGEDPQPTPDTIAGTIYYQANDAFPGRVLIAAAGANYFAPSAAEYIPFSVKFRVKQFQGRGVYPIGLQQTIIGPETALNAGYTENVALAVAAGLAPDAAPETAQSYAVTLIPGSISVSGGYTISGTIKYGVPLDSAANDVGVNLFKAVGASYVFAGETVSSDGAYSFSGQPEGTYQIRVNSLKPGYQRAFVSADIDVSGATSAITVPEIVLAAFQPLVGQATLNGQNVPGLKVKVVRKSDSFVIGFFNVDPNGNFVTTPLPGSSSEYDIYAVYGGVASATAMTYGTPFDYTDLTLVDLEVSIDCMDTRNYMVHVIQDDGKLEKTVSGLASSDPEVVTISNLISGKDYLVSMVGDGIPVTYFDNDLDPKQTTVFSESDLINVTDATPAVEFTFCLIDTYEISGNVTRGSAGEAITVYAISTDSPNVYVTTSDSADGGSYTLEVFPGEYMVSGLYDGAYFYYKTAAESTQIFSETVIVDASSEDVGTVNIILDVDETNASFYGLVTQKRADGDPVPFALILGESADRIVVTETDEQGGYSLEGFNDGETARIFMPQFPGNDQTDDASNDGTEVDLIVNQGWTITGVVQVGTDALATVSGATVYLKDSAGMVAGLPVRSDSAGEFRLPDVAAGIYTINATYPAYKKYADDIDVQGDEDIVIMMEAGAFITGTITDGTNNLEGVTVIVTGLQTIYSASTDANGVYTVEGLENDQVYGVFAIKEGYLPQHAPTVTAVTAGTTQDFIMPAVGTTYTVSGAITDDGADVADGTKLILYSSNAFVYFKTTTSSGNYSFSDVVESDDYVLIIRRLGEPVVIDAVGLVNVNTVHDVTISPSTISGTIDLSDDAAGQTVYVYLVSGSEDVLNKIIATDAGGGDYTYSFNVRSGVLDYKILAFSEGYGLKWYDGKDDFSTADDVPAGNNAADISLTAN